MPETETVRVRSEDKERINQIADAKGISAREVVSQLLHEPVCRCPECGDAFDPEEVDPDSIEERGLMSCGVDRLVRGEREVKSFACPACDADIRPEDVEMVPATETDGVTASELGVSGSETDRDGGETGEFESGGTAEERA